MIRKIIEINQEKCNGCRLCVDACHEGAIGIVDGKATLLRDDYCDGLGDCLPVCPTGAIKFVEREADEFNKEAVMENMKKKMESTHEGTLACGCSGTTSKEFQRDEEEHIVSSSEGFKSKLKQWPVQIQLVPVNAPYFQNKSLLIAADCTAYAYGNFHNEFMKGKITLVGCPKLDSVDYTEKLTEIIKNNDVKSVTVVRMEVPCCGGIESAVKNALIASGKFIPWQVVTITTDGKILED
ncbi:ATP-binding protein [Fusobacterium sp. PH5-44]|uniref:ATP-binding protein n=1 Tax=unclassified Fusobacterium TaxID=2648384 RepID=UPI003D1AA59E